MASPDGPGAVVLIARGDRALYRAARGRANIELGVPLSPDQVFRIASVTKIFTAATVLKLVEAGSLSLDDTLVSYIPNFPNGSQITIRQLLNHTAGLSDIAKTPQPGYFRRDLDMAAKVADIADRAPNFAPGTGWGYSNSGYILLGAVIEKVTGKPWQMAMQDLLLVPLRLTHTAYSDASRIAPGRVAGYTSDGPDHAVRNARFISMTIPATAGALESTADDLLLWMRALTSGRVISPESFRRMIEPAPDPAAADRSYRYGLGVYLWAVRGAAMIGHTGQIDGFASAVVWLPEQDVTLVVLANDDNFNARTFARRLAAIAIGSPYPEVVAVPLSQEAMRALEGAYRIDDRTVRTLSVKDGKLFAQRGSGNVLPLQATADGRLHFVPDELSYFAPVRDAEGRVVRLDYYAEGEGPARPLPRIGRDPG